MANINLWNRTIRPPDIGNEKPDRENSSEVPQDQAGVLLQAHTGERLDSPIVQAVQASLSVGFEKKNVKGIDKNDIGQLQELSATVLSVLSIIQAENEKSNERLVARLQTENERTDRKNDM